MHAVRRYSFRRAWKRAHRLIVPAVATLVAVLGSTQVAVSAPTERAACAVPTFADGLAQSVFSANSATWLRGEAWVKVPGVDSDRDGVPDRVHIDITRPAETADPACHYKAPVAHRRPSPARPEDRPQSADRATTRGARRASSTTGRRTQLLTSYPIERTR
jgi:hypothetical protein